jgi:hypothetical protein
MVVLLLQKLVARLRSAGQASQSQSGHSPAAALKPIVIGGRADDRGSPLGMVQVGDQSFRVLLLAGESYGIVRLLDDAYLGSFVCEPRLRVWAEPEIDEEWLRTVARTAVQRGRTRWIPQAS